MLDDATGSRRLQTLRELININKWEVNQAAGRYICSHEELQRISIRNRLDDFMQRNGAELAAALAPELMGIKSQPAMIKNRAFDRTMAYLREVLSVWLTAGNEINYSAQDNDILTAIGYRPSRLRAFAPSRLRRMISVKNSPPCTEHCLPRSTRRTGRTVACLKNPVNPTVFKKSAIHP